MGITRNASTEAQGLDAGPLQARCRLRVRRGAGLRASAHGRDARGRRSLGLFAASRVGGEHSIARCSANAPPHGNGEAWYGHMAPGGGGGGGRN